jgi:hypothetical protein
MMKLSMDRFAAQWEFDKLIICNTTEGKREKGEMQVSPERRLNMATNVPEQAVNFCQRCGENLPQMATVCPRCGYPVGGTTPGRSHPAYSPNEYGIQQVPKTNRPLIAGICLILSGLIGIGLAILTLTTIDSMVAQLVPMFPQLPESEIRSIFYVIIGAWAFFGTMAILGGIMAIRRRHWAIAIIGGIFGLLTFGIVLLEGTLLGLIGLILVVMSRMEFRRK